MTSLPPPAEREPLILIVDDDDAVRRSLAYLLASVSLKSEAFADARRFFDKYPQGLTEQPGCILLDVRMPMTSGLEVQEQLARSANLAPIVIITGHGDVPMAVSALKNGAADFMEKPINDQALIDMLFRMIALSRKRLAGKFLSADIKARLDLLTDRERDVLRTMLQGKAGKEVAQALAISPRTVEVHRSALMAKMGVKSIATLTQQVLSVEPDLLED